MSIGQVIAHEFMHVQLFKHPSGAIDDVKATLPSCGGNCNVYGASRCEEFAHLNAPNPNPKTLVNADNYAWWATGAYFANLWGIAPSKFRLKARDEEEDEADAGGLDDGWAMYADNSDPEINADTFSMPPPNDADNACTLNTAAAGSPVVKCPDQSAFTPAPATEPDPPLPGSATADSSAASSTEPTPHKSTPTVTAVSQISDGQPIATAPPKSTAAPAKHCTVDCGSEIRPGTEPVCYCSCSDGSKFRIGDGSPPCPQ